MSAFEYQLTRSARRKTLSIVIRRGKVKVLAPQSLPSKSIDAFINEKSSWVLQKLQSQQVQVEQEKQSQKQFVEGESFLYLGDEYPLQISAASKSAVELVNGVIFVSLSNRVKTANKAAFVQKLLQDWYKQQLTDYLATRLDDYCAQMQVSYSELNVRSYKRRWGSCSAKGRLSFNYLLMMAPGWVIDYVIVHELSHLTHLNHSARFWAEVKRYYPGYKQATEWLKVYGLALRLD